MLFEVLTLFPRMLDSPLDESLLGKARAAGLLRVELRDIREYASGRHRVCDDSPYGGGAGMVMKPEPLVAAIEAARTGAKENPHVILLSPRGRTLDHAVVAELAQHQHLVLVCGRYEGVDERIRSYVDDEISVGDYVLSGGEPAALVIIDAVSRLVPGVLGNEQSSATDSFVEGLLEYPQYTRPPDFRGERVPEVLLSGDHAKIRRWRRTEALLVTRTKRPDLFARFELTDEDVPLLAAADQAKPI